MSGFSNAVVGGSGILKRIAIRSFNYVLGTTGWTINADGSAEFNNLNIRGSFFGLKLIINSNGIFVYSGTPALGNLVASVVSTSGTDGFTNPTFKTISVYGSNGSYVNVDTSNGFNALPAVTFNSPNMTHVTDLAQIASDNVHAGLVNEQVKLILSSGKENHLDDGAIQLFSESADATIGAAVVVEFGGSFLVTINRTVFLVQLPIQNSSVSTNPTLITTDTPHAIALDANWSTLAGQPVPQVQLCSDGMVQINGAIQFNVNIANNAINNGAPLAAASGLFPGYRPSKQVFIAGAPGSAGISIGTNGVIVAAQAPGQNTVFCNFDGRYPINLL